MICQVWILSGEQSYRERCFGFRNIRHLRSGLVGRRRPRPVRRRPYKRRDFIDFP